MTPIEAFDFAIELSLSAPDDERSSRAVKLAEEIAMQLTPDQVQQVLTKYEMENQQ